MRASLFSILALVAAVVVTACGSSTATKNGNGSGSGSGGGSGGSSGGGSSGGSSGGGSGSSSGSTPFDDAGEPDGDIITTPDAGGGTSSYTVQFGPITVQPGVENTQCIVVPLGNVDQIHVGVIHDVLGTASHHMILYKVAAQATQATPFDCQPFQGALDPSNGNPLIISQKQNDTLTLPPNVAFTLDPNQMVRLEMHYINANTIPVTLLTTSTLTTIPDADYKYDASFLFIGDPEISIPANSTYTTGMQYFALPSQYDSSNFFAITGHEHHLGTEVQIWSATSSSDPGTSIYTSTSWSDPPTSTFAPPLHIPTGGGFKFQCNWDNTTTNTVSFGESANDEMCFFWAYYWPSQGASVCFTASGLSACCPGASPLCSQF
jgi:hypothetical protein